jgi:hypothetical protein
MCFYQGSSSPHWDMVPLSRCPTSWFSRQCDMDHFRCCYGDGDSPKSVHWYSSILLVEYLERMEQDGLWLNTKEWAAGRTINKGGDRVVSSSFQWNSLLASNAYVFFHAYAFSGLCMSCLSAGHSILYLGGSRSGAFARCLRFSPGSGRLQGQLSALARASELSVAEKAFLV